jgi:hypothetical protein
MTVRPPGPFLLDIPYVQTGEVHHFTVNCDVVGPATIGLAPTVVTMRSQGSGPLLLSGAADDLWDVVRPLMPDTTVATQYVLWKYNGTNLDKTFISGGTLTAPNGSSDGDVVLASQAIFTFRSGGGNTGKLVVNDTPIDSNFRGPWGTGGIGVTAALKTYLLSPDCIVMARDRSFPVAALNESFGQNEKLWRRRYRS